MGRTDSAEALLRVAAAFLVAVMLTPVVRSVTIGLDETVGLAWPFSLRRCHVLETPGCAAVPAARLHAGR